MGKEIEEIPLCECGCGKKVSKVGNRFIQGHNRQGIAHSIESIEKMSGDNHPKGMLGKHHTKEIKRKIAEGNKGKIISEVTRKKLRITSSGENNAMFGKHLSEKSKRKISEYQILNPQTGYDIVMHHWLYDDVDLSKYTMPMTRSEHTAMHNQMRLDGYVVSHINSSTDDNGLWGYR